MSISVETLALAKKYAEEVAGSGGGGANPDTIAEIVKQEFPGGVGYFDGFFVTLKFDQSAPSFEYDGTTYHLASTAVPTEEDIRDSDGDLAGLTVSFSRIKDIADGIVSCSYSIMGSALEIFIVAYEGNVAGATPGIYLDANGIVAQQMLIFKVTSGQKNSIDNEFIPKYFVKFARASDNTVSNITFSPSVTDVSIALLAGNTQVVAIEEGYRGSSGTIYSSLGVDSSGSIRFVSPVFSDGTVYSLSIEMSSETPTGTITTKKIAFTSDIPTDDHINSLIDAKLMELQGGME